MTRFEAWLKTARGGEAYVYHAGSWLFGPDVNAARKAFDDGRVTLVQKRLDHGDGPMNQGSLFEYIAIKLRNRARVPAILKFNVVEEVA